ncbi:O-antigen/teichoic acid export membrane protein [Sphingomonas aerophila]|uniref:O-antigen/teichoic acid export membrane protein n=2 Tax=Sphingomonas aerophila TaxID=1344948 RepID=A0A7W9BBU8_9SPHN|nr:O-antigen/teichoic acid export membrane protein [Sphingomonas aerophila]
MTGEGAGRMMEHVRNTVRRLPTWERVRQAVLHRRSRAVGSLLTGTAATAAISLVSVAVTARALGPASYGILALILTLGQASERLLSFQSWQPLIRYGATLNAEADRADLRSLFKFGLLLDLAGGATAWAAASILSLAAHWVTGLPLRMAGLALIYMTSLLFTVNGVSTAIFRLYGHFHTMARIQIANALVRLALVIIAISYGAGLRGFVILWAITQIQGSLTNFAAACVILRTKARITGLLRAPVRGISDRFPGLWRFTWGANAALTLSSSVQQIDTLIVGWLASPASAGLYHIAKRVSRVIQQVGSQVEAVIYPELSRMAAQGQRKALVRVVLQTEILLAIYGAACVAALLLTGERLLSWTAGPAFAAAAPLLTVQVFAVSLGISGAASRAALLALGKQPAVMRTVMMATAGFYLAAPPLVTVIGAMGANIAHVVFAAIWLTGLSLSLRRTLRHWPAPREGALAVAGQR